MKTKYLTLLIATVCINSVASTPPALTPRAVKDDTKRIGAKAVVNKLYSSDRWQVVLKNIESGDATWLNVVGDLAEGTDAGTSEDLQVSLATALPKNPRGVLKVTGAKDFLSVDDICGAPFIEPEHTFLLRYLADARRSLGRLKDPEVEGKRVECLAQIDKVLAEEKARGH
jgi:hypothetical protein